MRNTITRRDVDNIKGKLMFLRDDSENGVVRWQGDSRNTVAMALDIIERQQNILHSLNIKELERRADVLYSDGLRALFREEKDPIAVIKWMSIYEEMEACVDRCKDVADELEAVVVKNK